MTPPAERARSSKRQAKKRTGMSALPRKGMERIDPGFPGPKPLLALELGMCARDLMRDGQVDTAAGNVLRRHCRRDAGDQPAGCGDDERGSKQDRKHLAFLPGAQPQGDVERLREQQAGNAGDLFSLVRGYVSSQAGQVVGINLAKRRTRIARATAADATAARSARHRQDCLPHRRTA